MAEPFSELRPASRNGDREEFTEGFVQLQILLTRSVLEFSRSRQFIDFGRTRAGVNDLHFDNPFVQKSCSAYLRSAQEQINRKQKLFSLSKSWGEVGQYGASSLRYHGPGQALGHETTRHDKNPGALASSLKPASPPGHVMSYRTKTGTEQAPCVRGLTVLLSQFP